MDEMKNVVFQVRDNREMKLARSSSHSLDASFSPPLRFNARAAYRMVSIYL